MDSVKISSLELENVKRIKAVRLVPTEKGLTVIGGNNAQGKTSVLDAIAWALGGDRYRPSTPNRGGSVVPPRIRIELSNGLVVERAGKNSALKVTDPTGQRGGQQQFISYDNSGIQPQDQGQAMGEDMGLRLPLFDVSISSEKASPYSRLSQNEMAMSFYSAGFFRPELATQALACMELMDFDGKAKTMNLIRQNAEQYQAMQQMAMLGIGAAVPAAEPQTGEMPEADLGGESSVTKNARQRVANATDPG